MRYVILLWLLLNVSYLDAMERPAKKRRLESQIIRQPLKLFDRTLLFIIAYYEHQPIDIVQDRIGTLPIDLQEKIGSNLKALQNYKSKEVQRMPFG